jgi:hypothetical protein
LVARSRSQSRDRAPQSARRHSVDTDLRTISGSGSQSRSGLRPRLGSRSRSRDRHSEDEGEEEEEVEADPRSRTLSEDRDFHTPRPPQSRPRSQSRSRSQSHLRLRSQSESPPPLRDQLLRRNSVVAHPRSRCLRIKILTRLARCSRCCRVGRPGCGISPTSNFRFYCSQTPIFHYLIVYVVNRYQPCNFTIVPPSQRPVQGKRLEAAP